MLNSRGGPPYLRAAGLAWSLPTFVTIPSAAGFAGKVLLAATLLGGLTWLAVGAVVNMAMSLYYLSLVTEIYLKLLRIYTPWLTAQVIWRPRGQFARNLSTRDCACFCAFPDVFHLAGFGPLIGFPRALVQRTLWKLYKALLGSS